MRKGNIDADYRHGCCTGGRILREGKVVAFATGNSLWVGACADNPQALATMYAMKNRPLAHPSIIHLSDFAQAEE